MKGARRRVLEEVNRSETMRAEYRVAKKSARQRYLALHLWRSISFWELMGILLKVHSFLSLLWLPFVVAAIMLSSTGLFTCSNALLNGFRIVVVAAFCQPFIALLTISPVLNDRKLLPFIIFGAILFVPVGIGFFAATQFVPVALCGALGVALSVLLLIFYGRAFNRSQFDLLPVRKPNPNQ